MKTLTKFPHPYIEQTFIEQTSDTIHSGFDPENAKMAQSPRPQLNYICLTTCNL